MIDSQMDDMIKEKLALKEQVDSLEQNLSKQIKETECLLQTFTVFKNESKEKENKYLENEIDLEKKIKELDNIIFKVGYQNLFYLKKAQRIKPTLYDGIVMSAKHVAIPVIDDEKTLILEEESRSKIILSDASPVKIEAPKELPKVSLVNESLKKLKFHLVRFDNMVKIMTTPDARTEGEWGFEHTKAIFNNEIIPFLKSLKDIFNVFNKDLLNEIMEVQIVFDQMDAAVQQSSVDKQCLEIAKKELLLENVFKEQFDSIKKTHVRTKEQSDSLIDKLNLKSAENEDLKAQIQDKVFVITSLKNDLQKLKGKETVDIAAQTPSAYTIIPGMFKLDLEPLAHRSKPTGNKKNDRISQTPSRNMKNKVEDVDVKHSLKSISKLICTTCSSKKAKIVESKNVNHSEPNHTWGSNATDIPSSSSLVMIGCPDCYLVSGLWMFKTYDREPLSAHELLYYVKRLGHNLFSVAQFCDADLEVAFQKHTCFIRNLEGVDLLSGSRDTNLYTISLDDMLKISLVCLLSKASMTKSWLWHCRLSHLNFGTLNKLDKYSLARGIPRLKFQKDHLIKNEALEAIIKCIKNIQVRLNATVRNVRTYNGTEFVNQTLREFYENVGISHQTSVARTPQQNGVVERRNRTLVEAACTMLIFLKAPLFLWAEAINTDCYTQNRSLIHLRYNKTPYELMQDKKPDLLFFHVFGALCYPTNDNDDLGKLDAKADIGIFVGYAPAKKAFRIYNKRTQKIIETIHVTFDELTAMAYEQFSSGPGLHSMTPTTSSSGLVPNPVSQHPCIPPPSDDWDCLFQPMFDEYFTPPSISVSLVQEAAAPRAMVLKNHPKTPTFRDDPLHESLHEDSTSQGSSLNVRQTHTSFEHLGRWTKDHPIANVIGNPSRSVSTRKQLQTDAMWCYFDAFLTSVEPKNFKQAMTKPSWIDAMQEEIYEFQRLEV
ncbi:retrovirus-related pol polyprotein from transposon TNT 1-94 [Tanacetum coccineum]